MESKSAKNNHKTPKISQNKTNINGIQSLMKEMNLNCKLQEEILHFAESGKSLPYVPKELIISPSNTEEKVFKEILKLPPRPLQRMKYKILSSGSYERDPYRPSPSKTRPAKEKERLQNMMAFGKDIDEAAARRERVPPAETSCDLFDEILNEIKERLEFLQEMDELGQRKKYSAEIEFQICLRWQELEKLDRYRAEEAYLEYGTF